MNNSPSLLRSLPPNLNRISRAIDTWLKRERCFPLSPIAEVELRQSTQELERQAHSLSRERVLLNIVLMGGTGVGKSTLLNALAKKEIAQASATRPTTRDPVVYHHRSVPVHLLERPLQGCVLVPHDRPTLENKILVDTPDLDSNEPANRKRLEAVLAVADLVVYVGSQEKYHDKLGWELFRKHRPRRGFAFVLNKWDRCQSGLHGGGMRPDEDLLQDLQREGFLRPLLFRVCAQKWAEANGREPDLPEGEQFRELESWLENELTDREVEAIRARGVYQVLIVLAQTLQQARPPDLAQVALAIREAWAAIIKDEALSMADAVVQALNPFGPDIERQFAITIYGRLRGPLGWFFEILGSIRSLIKRTGGFLPWKVYKGSDAKHELADVLNLNSLFRSLAELAVKRHISSRNMDLVSRLLLVAAENGFSIQLLRPSLDRAAESFRQDRFQDRVQEAATDLQLQWFSQNGLRSWVYQFLDFLGEWVPLAVLTLSVLYVLNSFFRFAPEWGPERTFTLLEAVVLPIVAVAGVTFLQWLPVRFLLPVTWKKVRGMFKQRLRECLFQELQAAYAEVPEQVAQRLLEERRQVEGILDEIQRTLTWLDSREQGRDTSTTAALWEKASTR